MEDVLKEIGKLIALWATILNLVLVIRVCVKEVRSTYAFWLIVLGSFLAAYTLDQYIGYLLV